MIGDHYWSTGICIEQAAPNAWRVWVEFFDDGFCKPGSTEGTLHARYVGPLHELVDTVKADAERLGIRWRIVDGSTPHVCYKGDGEWQGSPVNARELADERAERIGWAPIYKALDARTETKQ